MMKISPGRALKLFLKLLFCFSFVPPTVWLALPFTTVSVEERSTYIQNALASGQTVVTAWDAKPFIKTDEDALDEGWCSECTSVLFHWQFARVGDEVHLFLAPRHTDNEHRAFELRAHFKSASEWNQRASGGHNESWSPYFADLWSTPITLAGAREDKRISQGWFHEIDRHLIQHTLLGWTTKVDIRAVLPAPGRIEFWRGVAIDRASNHISDDWDEILNKNNVLQNHTQAVEVYNQMKRAERDVDLVAAFEAFEIADARNIVVKELKGDLPSRTWPFRKELLTWVPRFIVGPVMLFKAADDVLAPRFAGFLIFLMTFPLIYVGVVGCCWISAGGPNIARWVSRFWMTRYLVPHRLRRAPDTHQIWGASGPVDSVFDAGKSEG